MMGQKFQQFEAPNRFGLLRFYTLAWKENPTGTLVNWHGNTSLRRVLGTGQVNRRLITAAIAAVISIAGAAAVAPASRDGVTFANASGWLHVAGMEDADLDNPFVQPLRTNGRRCVSRHTPAAGLERHAG